MDELDGKVAVVTGAGSGIGRATAQLLARSGMRVVLADIDKEALDTEVDSLRRDRLGALGVVTDVADSLRWSSWLRPPTPSTEPSMFSI